MIIVSLNLWCPNYRLTGRSWLMILTCHWLPRPSPTVAAAVSLATNSGGRPPAPPTPCGTTTLTISCPRQTPSRRAAIHGSGWRTRPSRLYPMVTCPAARISWSCIAVVAAVLAMVVAVAGEGSQAALVKRCRAAVATKTVTSSFSAPSSYRGLLARSCWSLASRSPPVFLLRLPDITTSSWSNPVNPQE